MALLSNRNRYEITGGYNNHYQGRYQMGCDALADVGVDLSRNCAAPLTAYYALKENIYGTETYNRI